MNTSVKNLKGELGGTYITDTAAHTGQFDAIQALEAAVATIVSPTMSGLASVPIPAGVIIYGNFTSVTLASGKVIAYNSERR